MGILSRIEAAREPPERKASVTWPVLAGLTGGGAKFMNRRFPDFAGEGYRKNVIAYRCISMLAQSAALVPWRVFKDDTEVESGELVDLVAQPNPWQGWSALIEAYMAYYLIAGDSFVEAVGPKRGLPRELYALRPDRMKRKMNKVTGAPDAYVWSAGGAERRWDMDPVTGKGQILHWRTYNPMDPWDGMSPVEAAAFSIDQHNSAGKHNARLLQNSATPSGALTYAPKEGDGLTSEQRAALRFQIQESFSGEGNAGRPLLLEDGMTWQAMGLSPKDIDWLKGKDVSAREIGLAYGVPGQLLGIPDSQTYANNREARLAFWEDSVIPLLGRGRDALNAWLSQWWPDQHLDYDLDGVPALTLQRERKAEGLTTLVNAGILTRNEAREDLGREAVDGGDALLVPSTLLPLDFDGEPSTEDDEADKLLAIPEGGTTPDRAEDLARLAYGGPALVEAAD